MRFSPTPPPQVAATDDAAYDASIRRVLQWAHGRFTELATLLNKNVMPEDQFNAEEYELTFGAVPGGQSVGHGLKRTPDRVYVVRADQNGLCYITARSATAVTVATSAVGTYRVRIS